MKGKNIITINGRSYDALSGMPVQRAPATQSANAPARPITAKPNPKPSSNPRQRVFSDFGAPAKGSMPKPGGLRPQAAPQKTKPPTIERAAVPATAHAIHQQPQRSQTLHRGAIKRPAGKPKKSPAHRSPTISKFGSLYNSASAPAKTAPAPQPAPEKPQANASVAVHPAVARAAEHMAQVPAKPAPVQSSKELKQMLIKERLAQVDATEKTQQPKRRGLFARSRRLTTILAGALAILLLGGYLTYLNLPNISMRVAATRAGVSAAGFPNYKPDGYNFAGPITYSPGEVAINFKSNTNDQTYAIKQKPSNWNSQAVLDNFVAQQTDSYLTYQERGLTIYAFDDKAAWVNGGLLYTIEGNAKLSGEQLLRIATSM